MAEIDRKKYEGKAISKLLTSYKQVTNKDLISGHVPVGTEIIIMQVTRQRHFYRSILIRHNAETLPGDAHEHFGWIYSEETVLSLLLDANDEWPETLPCKIHRPNIYLSYWANCEMWQLLSLAEK